LWYVITTKIIKWNNSEGIVWLREEEKMIELYDLGRCTHKPVKGMYEFIVDRASEFVEYSDLARALQHHAANREKPGYSISQEHFSEMCRIWVAAYRSGDFQINVPELTFPDTVTRFQKVKQTGRQIGILTSGSREFTEILYSLPVGENRRLIDFVDEYLLGEEIGDKDHPETFARLWDSRKGDIHSIYDDKLSVCEAAMEGLRQAGGSAQLYLVDRKGKYDQGELADKVNALRAQGIKLIRSFDEVRD